MSQADFKHLNVPALLGRKAWAVSQTGDGGLVEDAGWTGRLSERLSQLVLFFRNHGLLNVEVGSDISELVLCFSDFTEVGKRFIKSGAPDKWLASFDRDPTKPCADVSYLERQLTRIRKQA